MTPELQEHLAETQQRAHLIQALMGALELCVRDTGRRQLAYTLIEAAAKAAKEIGSDIDSATLEKIAPVEHMGRG